MYYSRLSHLLKNSITMTRFLSSELVNLLACPNCHNNMFEEEGMLKCFRCGKKYEIRNGIPLLYPDNLDIAHLREEENLARMMKRPRLNKKEQFILSQWDNSKQEFWEMVKSNVEAPPKSLINLGCGYDACFSQFESNGYTFVNFDIVYDMLNTLKTDHGAKFCVAGDIRWLPFKNQTFDYLVSIDVIHHHSNNVPSLLKSFRNLLKPGGSIFLEDPNAWGISQMVKSVLLPRPLHGFLRSTYHTLKGSSHRPANYEFSTSVWYVEGVLRQLGFHNIRLHPNNAYPCIGEKWFRVYQLFSKFDRISKYHNYHYMLSATI